MVVGEGLLGALRLALRVVACGNAFSLRSNRTLVEASHPSRMGWIWGTERSVNLIRHRSDGGGGRITRRVAPRPSGRCLRQRFLAPLESNLGRSFLSFPASEEYKAMYLYESRCVPEVMVVGEGLLGALRLALRVVACGNAFSLRSNRTFEVDDGRFTVCSLWPLGNPTRGNSNFEVKLRYGGGGRIIRRFAPHPSGRCLRQRCLAFARLEPWSKILTLPDKCKHRLRSSVLPQQRGKEWWWGKDSNLRSR